MVRLGKSINLDAFEVTMDFRARMLYAIDRIACGRITGE